MSQHAAGQPLRWDIVLVFHLYQPEVVPDEEISRLAALSYGVLLDLLESASIPYTLNVQGVLLDRLVSIAPDLIDRVRQDVANGRAELLTSGYYHPLFPLISPEDAAEQITRNTRSVESAFGVTPAGLWPPELSWTPYLSRLMADQGLRWVVVDSLTLALAATIPEWHPQEIFASTVNRPRYQPLLAAQELFRAYSSSQGTSKIVFLIRHHQLSLGLIPNYTAEARPTLDHLESELLRELRAGPGGVVTLATDAEVVDPRSVRTLQDALSVLGSLEGGQFVLCSEAIERWCEETHLFLPTSSWELDLDLWTSDLESRTFLGLLSNLGGQLRYLRTASRLIPKSRTALRSQIDDELCAAHSALLRAQSSCWLYWTYLNTYRSAGYGLLDTVAAHLANAERLLGT